MVRIDRRSLLDGAASVHTAKAICAVRDEFRRTDPELPRLAFADILVPHQGPAAQAVEVAVRMLEAGVDGVGVHLQADARRADPADGRTRYDLPPDQIARHVAGFIAEVSGP